MPTATVSRSPRQSYTNRLFLSVLFPILFENAEELYYQSVRYTPSIALDKLVGLRPQDTSLSRQLMEMFPGILQINLYIPDIEAHLPASYISLSRKRPTDPFTLTSRRVTRIKRVPPTQGVFPRWGSSPRVPHPDKAIALPFRLERITVGSTPIIWNSPEGQYQLSVCVALAKLLGSKESSKITLWGNNSGRTSFNFASDPICPENIRYGALPRGKRFHVRFYGQAVPDESSPFSAAPTVIAPEFTRGAVLTEDEVDALDGTFLTAVLAIFPVVTLTYWDTQTVTYAKSYDPTLREFSIVTLPSKPRRSPAYKASRAGWIPDPYAWASLCNFLLDLPNYRKNVFEVFTSLYCDYDPAQVVQYIDSCGVVFSPEEEHERLVSILEAPVEGPTSKELFRKITGSRQTQQI